MADNLSVDWIKERVCKPLDLNILALEGVLLILGRDDTSSSCREKAVNIAQEAIAQMRKAVERLDGK